MDLYAEGYRIATRTQLKPVHRLFDLTIPLHKSNIAWMELGLSWMLRELLELV